MINATREEVCIASYLHDIGKFAQRAEAKEYYASDMEGQVLPPFKGRYSHYHALYTFGFIYHYAEKHCFPDGVNGERVLKMASYHHFPGSVEESLIAEADRLSSGSERASVPADDVAFPGESGRNQYKSIPLIHMPSELRDPSQEKAPHLSYVSMRPLDRDALVQTGEDPVSSSKYRDLWDLFDKDFQACCEANQHDIQGFILALDSLLERYTWCIPSSTMDIPDISLYQHAKTTAAFALSLYNYYADSADLSENMIKDRQAKVFLILSGDASGIQKYIFSMKTDAGSAKLLRARSFEVLIQAFRFAQNIVQRAGCGVSNIVSFSGGRFLLLLPNTAKVKDVLAEAREELEVFSVKEYVGRLAFVLSSGVALSGAELMDKNNGERIQRQIAEDSEEAKKKKLQLGIAVLGPVQDSLYDELLKSGECPVCGLHPAGNEHADGGLTASACPACSALVRTGGQLVRDGVDWLSVRWDVMDGIGKSVKLAKEHCHEQGFHSYSINAYKPGFPRMFLPYLVPVSEGDVLTFGQIGDKAEGNKKIAMLKADVDNLGYVFMKDIPRWTLSRYATLSQDLHFFFSSYFQDFVDERFGNRIYTVFSGGDDMCLIGAWNDIIRFASEFHVEFEKFASRNPEIRMSAGIALSSPGLPLSSLAEMAESELKESKAFPGKNMVSLFGRTLSWEKFAESINDSATITGFLDKESVSQGFVYGLLDLSDRALRMRSGTALRKAAESGATLRDGLWMSSLRYSMARNLKGAVCEEERAFFEKYVVSPEKMEDARVAVSMALYKHRRAE